MSRQPQISATISPELYQEIVTLSEKDGRTLSQMTGILLESAVKERRRLREKAKKRSKKPHQTEEVRS